MRAPIGVLALQGGFAAHLRALAELGLEAHPLRHAAQLRDPARPLGGLVLPGGESSVQLKLIQRHGLSEPLAALVEAGTPVLATCAGLILSAAAVSEPAQPGFGWLDVAVSRNAYGPQVHSFEAWSDQPLHAPQAAHPAGAAADGPLPLIFIRAPRLTRLGPAVEVLATLAGEPILVRQGRVVGACFHPELTADRRVHQLAFGPG